MKRQYGARRRKLCHETGGLLSNLGSTSLLAFRLLSSASIPNSKICVCISFQDFSTNTLVKDRNRCMIFSIVKALLSLTQTVFIYLRQAHSSFSIRQDGDRYKYGDIRKS